MNIYLISQDKETGYDTYDSAVVIAKTEEDARNTHPDSSYSYKHGEEYWYRDADEPSSSTSWAQFSISVKVELLGSTDKEAGVVLASFNAG